MQGPLHLPATPYKKTSMIITVMGVTGSGKSTVGQLLAQKLHLPFLEGDEFHPASNIDKMSHGIPLNDDDRYPWLLSITKALKEAEAAKGAVLACSALKESYREILQQHLQEKITWIYLYGPEELLRERMKSRPGHFMPGRLLHSQLETLEEPQEAMRFSIEEQPETIVKKVLHLLDQ